MKKDKHNTAKQKKTIKSKKPAVVNIRQDRCNKTHRQGKELSSKSLGIQLLADMLAVFKEKSYSKIRSNTLIRALCDDPKKCWATIGRGGKPISARKICSLLKEFKVHSLDIRFKNGIFKGYRKQWIKKARASL